MNDGVLVCVIIIYAINSAEDETQKIYVTSAGYQIDWYQASLELTHLPATLSLRGAFVAVCIAHKSLAIQESGSDKRSAHSP